MVIKKSYWRKSQPKTQSAGPIAKATLTFFAYMQNIFKHGKIFSYVIYWPFLTRILKFYNGKVFSYVIYWPFLTHILKFYNVSFNFS